MKRHELPEALDPKHIQAFLGIGRKQTYELLHNPPFHVIRIGRNYKVSKESFLSWFDGKEQIK
ncbi:helix-turn-helix domain-containing protein [Evansella cellulosilytica]|uniref:Prophage LambdaBa02, DNA-binding protein, putative n=1 Tax=Evansella cellulosilytica (strain ATCC 21833 / DSM 2522 / FERM P-1141 / JCM 9156 / N-4) TaxID=649639 RepID=E6TVE9_EVAC2|nr:helix-turn-helix domain-containing protein [Evansella cellulosilytica]ADU30966.1 prophage LambdaBa02, DNA-binding protein, putative [Evansella cellulosilytica DSM 2522]